MPAPPASVDTGPGPRPHVAPAVLARHTCHVTASCGHMSSCCPVFLASFIVSHRISFQFSRNNVVIICLVLILVSIKCENNLLTEPSGECQSILKGSPVASLVTRCGLPAQNSHKSCSDLMQICSCHIETLSWKRKTFHNFVDTNACKHPQQSTS